MFSICVIVILATKTLFEEQQLKTLQKQKQKKPHLFYSFALEVVCTSTSLRRQYKQTDPIAQG